MGLAAAATNERSKVLGKRDNQTGTTGKAEQGYKKIIYGKSRRNIKMSGYYHYYYYYYYGDGDNKCWWRQGGR
jgi:hypothetical protein